MNDSLTKLNTTIRQEAVAMLEPMVERGLWVAGEAVDRRPFASDEALAEALVEVILAASPDMRVALFNNHPELAGHEARQGQMTEASTSEQSRLGLDALTHEQALRLDSLNAQYRARFGFPFILALHRQPDLAAVFATMERRLLATPLEEHTTTLAEIASVIRSRCRAAFGLRQHQISPTEIEPLE